MIDLQDPEAELRAAAVLGAADLDVQVGQRRQQTHGAQLPVRHARRDLQAATVADQASRHRTHVPEGQLDGLEEYQPTSLNLLDAASGHSCSFEANGMPPILTGEIV